MKRWITRAGAALAAAVLAVTAAGGAVAQGREAVVAKVTTPTASLEVGAAVRDITPTPDMLPIARRPASTLTSVLDPLRVRVIAMDSGGALALLVVSETGRGPYGPQFAAAVAEHIGIPVEAVFFTATHSHAAPEITSAIDLDYEAEGVEPTNLQKWGSLVMAQMLDAADEAVASMQPAEVGIGYSESYVNVNRQAMFTQVAEDGTVSDYPYLGYNPTGVSDKEVATIRFTAEDGSPIAFIVNYAVHGTVMHANTIDDGTTVISSDLPGYVSTYLEQKYPGSVAAWISGAAGDQNPIVQNDMYTADPITGEWTETMGADANLLTYLGAIHFADVERAIDSITESTSDAEVDYAYRATTIPKTDGTTFPVSLQLLSIGDITLLGYPGELFTQLGLDIKAATPENTLVVNHTWQKVGQYNGYTADDAAIAYGGFGTTAGYETGYISQALVSLAKDLVTQARRWTMNGDGTATRTTDGKVVIVGVDGIPGTSDDNRILSPTGEVLRTKVPVTTDSAGVHRVSLGNTLWLYGGDDGLLGTTDDVVMLGRFVQSAEAGAEAEPLAWRLLDIQGGTAVLATARIIDGLQYDLENDSADWAQSNLRSWLNSTGGVDMTGDDTGFLATAFTAAERRKLVLTDVDMDSDSSFIAYNTLLTSDWWGYWSTVGTPTTDLVRALSGEEAFAYFGRSTIATQAELGHDPANYTNAYVLPTDWAHANGVKINTGGNGPSFYGFSDSWTRSPGAPYDGTNYYGVFLGTTGSLNVGRPVTRVYGAMPVITVSLQTR